MKILVTGALGTIGRKVIPLLAANGHECIAFDRITRRNCMVLRKIKKYCTFFRGDIRNAEDVANAANGVDRIIHLAAMIPPAAEEFPELAKAINTGGTKNIVDAALQQDPVPWVLFTSSISIYGDRRHTKEICTNDPLIPNDNYAEHKVECEKLIRNAPNLPFIIFRLSAIFSTENLKLVPYLFRMPLDTELEICTSDDTAYALSEAVKHFSLLGSVQHIAGGKACRTTYRKFLTSMFELFGFKSSDFPPDRAFSSAPFHCGYMDTKGSQEKLHYQRHSLKDFYREVARTFRFRRFFVTLFEPLAKAVVLRMSHHRR